MRVCQVKQMLLDASTEELEVANDCVLDVAQLEEAAELAAAQKDAVDLESPGRALFPCKSRTPNSPPFFQNWSTVGIAMCVFYNFCIVLLLLIGFLKFKQDK
ncbi:uncharacterized protein LOC115630725 [Scaptodrosophila lebanonensis]|uniref:Uncharacterized protein LOC115630725 n=1 Tax=Drosophila lebanonensis TaxID=7225 RepID=A0A6J2U5L2_DROLE|nr:uncharacterized protein LOC115630725 [Scaptodrosophila lebanonensis]